MEPLLQVQPLAFIVMALGFGLALITVSLLDARLG